MIDNQIEDGIELRCELYPSFPPVHYLPWEPRTESGVLCFLETARPFGAMILIVRKYQSNELKSLSIRDETYHRSSLQCLWYIAVVKTAQGHQSPHRPSHLPFASFSFTPHSSCLEQTTAYSRWLTRSMRAEKNPLGVSQASRERHHGPLAFVPSGTRSAQMPETFSASTHQAMGTRTTGQVTTKLLCTSQHGSSRQCPSDLHGKLWRRGTWYTADRSRYTQRKSQNTRQEKPYGTTR